MTSIKKGRMKDEHIWKDALDTLILSETLSHWAKAELKAGMKLSWVHLLSVLESWQWGNCSYEAGVGDRLDKGKAKGILVFDFLRPRLTRDTRFQNPDYYVQWFWEEGKSNNP